MDRYFYDMIDYLASIEAQYYGAIEEFEEALYDHFGEEVAREIIRRANDEELTVQDLKDLLEEYES
jgi:hypothetical protein